MTRVIPDDRWSAELDRFSRRNAGRRTMLEVDEPGIGTQRLVQSPLWGVAYDGRARTVDLMFGDFDEGRVQLTHSITDPVGIEILEYEEGGDRVLRIAYADGQALLHVERPAG